MEAGRVDIVDNGVNNRCGAGVKKFWIEHDVIKRRKERKKMSTWKRRTIENNVIKIANGLLLVMCSKKKGVKFQFIEMVGE